MTKVSVSCFLWLYICGEFNKYLKLPMDLKTKNVIISAVNRVEDRIREYQQKHGFGSIFDFIHEDLYTIKNACAKTNMIDENTTKVLGLLKSESEFEESKNGNKGHVIWSNKFYKLSQAIVELLNGTVQV